MIDCFFEDVMEVDVDVILDGEMVVVVGIMEYIEEVGVYFGDLVCFIFLYSLFGLIVDEI